MHIAWKHMDMSSMVSPAHNTSVPHAVALSVRHYDTPLTRIHLSMSAVPISDRMWGRMLRQLEATVMCEAKRIYIGVTCSTATEGIFYL